MQAAKTLIRLHECASWSESSLVARLIVGFGDLMVFNCFSISVISCRSPHRYFISVVVSFFFSRKCCTDESGTLHVNWTNVLFIPWQNLGRGLWPRKIGLSPPPPIPPHTPVIFYWPFPVGASAVVHYFCNCMSLPVCPGEILFLIAVWPFWGKETVLLAFCL